MRTSSTSRFLLSIAVLLFLISCFTLTVYAQPGDPEWDKKVKEVIEKSQKEKEKQHPKIQQILTELEDAYKKGGDEEAKKSAKERGISIKENNKITVFIMLDYELPPAEQIDEAELARYGVDIINRSAGYIKADIPINKIREIADNVKGVVNIRHPVKKAPASLTSEGVSITGGARYLSSGITGTGIKVAVIDQSFGGLSAAVSHSELPNNMVLLDCTGSSCISTTFASEPTDNKDDVHGTAVAEIVSDMAPTAKLYLMKTSDNDSIQVATNYCIDNGIKVINHSVVELNENFFRGECYPQYSNGVCSANAASASGILWVNGAGNHAKKHYEAVYSDPTVLGYHSTIPTISATAGEPITVWFTWDAWPATDQDFDIYLMDALTGFPQLVGMGGTDRQTGSHSPSETITVDAAPYTGTYYLFIVKYAANINPKFEVYSDHVLTPSIASSSLGSPADAASVLSVGMIHQSVWTTGDASENSSQGPTNNTVTEPNGRIKPDIMGPDEIFQNLTYPPYDTYNNFRGSSAAAPHVAGAAALLLQLYPQYTLAQLRNELTSSAIPKYGPYPENTYPNNIYGWGRLNLPLYTLAVAKNGTGSGTVTSSAAGINCGSDCGETYAPTTAVILTATPDVNSSFSGWSGGGRSGTGACSISMNADTTITWTFNVLPPVAAFTSSSTSGAVPIAINFTDQSVRATSWLWNFGDGATSTEQNPTHLYSTTGLFTVSLTATNSSGFNTMTNTNYISIQPCNVPVRIKRTQLVPYPTLLAAYNAAIDGDIIQSRAVTYLENITTYRNIAITMEGGFGCDYTVPIAGASTSLQGMITTNQGTLNITDFIIQQ